VAKAPEKNPNTSKSEVRVLPMRLQLGDRLTDKTGEYEVIGRPYTTAGGKTANVRVKRVEVRCADDSRLRHARAHHGEARVKSEIDLLRGRCRTHCFEVCFRLYQRTINPNTTTPMVNTTNTKSATLNSRLLLMSGHTISARADSTRSHLLARASLTRSHLLVGSTLAIDLPLADSRRVRRHVERNNFESAESISVARPASDKSLPIITSIFVHSNPHAVTNSLDRAHHASSPGRQMCGRDVISEEPRD